MKVHFLQHVSFEKPGYLDTLLHKNGYTSSCTPLFQRTEFQFTDLKNFDMLIILGGPMNVYEETQFPFLTKEKRFIEKAIKAGKKVLGICLGAQLIATVLGAKVTRNRVKEIGWYPVQMSDEFSKHSLLNNIPKQFTPLHWHGDTFEIPSGANRIAMSAACPNQGFIYSDHVIGLQFHLESSLASLKELVTHCSEELLDGEFIQKEQELFTLAREHIKPANIIMEQILHAL